MRRLLFVAAAIAALTAASVAVAHGIDGAKTAKSVTGTFSATQASVTTRTCTTSDGKSLSITPGLQIPLRTGGTISLDMPIHRSETNNEFATLNPAWNTDVDLTLSHPLLRGAGLAVNEAPIRIASLNYLSSEAATKLEIIRVLTAFGGAWRLVALFRLVPHLLRDRLYRWIARNRYRWFGRREACMVPSPEMQDRFLG